MASAAESGTETQNEGEDQILLYCHQCRRSIWTARLERFECPQCEGEFVEEIDEASMPLFSPRGQANAGGARAGLDPYDFYPRHTTGGLVIGVNFADFVIGNNFEQLMMRARYGSNPASKAAVDGMPTFKITEEHVGEDSLTCAVCKEDFALEEDAKQMPCKHIYHPDCILPWLKNHNTCPLCRFELAPDDPGAAGRDSDIRRFFQQFAVRRPVFNTWGNGTASGSREDDYYDSLTDVD